MFKKLLALIISALLFSALILPVSAKITAPVAPPSLSAQSAVLIEARDGEILCEKNAHTKMAMASTTKIMTALVAAESGKLQRVVSVNAAAVGVEGSSIYLYAGEKMTLCDLIAAMLLESANDAAAAIAIEVGGSIDGFCDMMNKKAKFYVVAIGEVDEWDCGSFNSYLEAFRTATDEWERRTPSPVHEVEIRLYVEDVEEEDCECFDCNTVSFKSE